MANNKNTLAISDDLGLSDITIPNIPKNIIFPEDLNKYLRDQVQYLTHENGMLYKNVSDLELRLKENTSKVSILSTELEKVQSTCTKNIPTGTNNLASTKIVELSKQLRERTSELETYKTKYTKLQQYANEVEKSKEKEEPIIPEQPKNEIQEQIKVLQDKLSSTNSKLCETRNSNSQLKTNMKLANKLLQQEIGDTFENLQAVINANGNWRGRAQIICDLQQKNNELKDKLKAREEKDSNTCSNRAEAPTSLTKWDKKLASLKEENEELQYTVQDFKRKLEASRARNKVVESENSALKAKVSAVTEQNQHDRDMITNLTVKVAHAQDIQSDGLRHKLQVIQELEQQNKSLQVENAKQSCKINNLNAQIDGQKRDIECSRSKVKKQPLIELDPKVKSPKSNFLETERLRLLELTKITNDKLDLERNAHSETHIKYLAERQKAAKLEAKVSRLQLNKDSDRTSVYSLKSHMTIGSSSDDKLQLAEETIKALQTRLEIERQEHRNSINEFSNILSNYGYVENNYNIE